MQSAYGGDFEFEQGLICETNGDFPQALRWYKKSSLLGNEKALHRSLSADFHKINSIFKRAQSKDEDLETYSFEKRIEAQKSLGIMFLYGISGLPQDIFKAHNWLSQSLQNGDLESYYYLGQLYEQQNNIGLALEHYFIGAKLSDKKSAFRYADYVVTGISISAIPAE